jgi:hypothetical protein
VLRIVDGIVFEGKRVPGVYRVALHELGPDQRELTVQPVVEWVESCELDPGSINAQVLRGEREDPDAEDKRRLQRLRSARRAKTRARRVCKVLGLDTLLTLTYRALVDDLATCKRHFELFVKRMRNNLGTFRFVAAFELQERGAWHVHIATHRIPPTLLQRGIKVKSFDAIRVIWRAVTGELGGNVDVSGRQARKGKRKITERSPAKVAAYLSKYLTKDFDDWPEGMRRLQTSPCEVPKPTVIERIAGSMADLVAMCYAFGFEPGRAVVTSRVGSFGDSFYLATERQRVDRSIHWAQ